MGMGSMMMNTFLTSAYYEYPVLFETFKASNHREEFGIFCVLFFAGFFMRGISFFGSYLEQVVFKSTKAPVVVENTCGCDNTSDSDTKLLNGDKTEDVPRMKHKPFGQVIKELFWPGRVEFFRDLVRLVIAFVVSMLGYALMLAAMTFIIVYFFAVVLGLACGQVFFNRLGIVLGINANFGSCACSD